MATLFFDGFDRATVIKQLDPNYWSTEYSKPGYPRYAFGGYSYINKTFTSNEGFTSAYNTYSVNNGVAPIGRHYGSWSFDGPYYSQILGNEYPGFGTPPGFLAITNVPVNDPNNLEFISYIQLSGFPTISGSKSYFGFRTLGIETKHLDYHDVAFPAGRFGDKHPFLAFCSGNFTGLLLSLVQITGHHLLPLKMYNPPDNIGVKRSIGLQVEQNNGISGVFDLNLSDTLPNFRITPLYTPDDTNRIPSLNNDCKILTIATDDTNRYDYGRTLARGSDLTSRWTHFEFEFNHINGGIKLKLEGSDALVENKDIYVDRDLWEIEIKISGFKYNNIRFFNRTYQAGAHVYDSGQFSYYSSYYPGAASPLYAAYYARGQVTLFDDITLVDNSGNDPVYYLGPDSKVLPLTPGITYLDNNYNTAIGLNNNQIVSDGLREWTPSTSVSDRRILASLDKDSSYIATAKPQNISSIVHSPINILQTVGGEASSYWRNQAGEAIGGLKVYNSARKNFLDSSFVNVFETGISDPYRNNVILLLHNEENPIKDYSKYNNTIIKHGTTTNSNDHKFDASGLAFYSTDINQSFLIANTDQHPEYDTFTIESWVKFTGQNDTVVLMDTRPRTLSEVNIGSNYEHWYRISCNPSSIKIENPAREFVGQTNDGVSWKFFSETSKLILPFPTVANTGEWHHIALVKSNPVPNTGQYTAYLNGISGTMYQRLFYPSGRRTINPYNYEYFTDFYDNNNNPISAFNGNFLVWMPSKMKSSDPVEGPMRFSLNPGFPYASVDGDGFPFLNDLLFAGNGVFFGNSAYVANKVVSPYVFIGYSGIIDDYRYTQNIARYNNNFQPQTTKFKAFYDDYIRFGPTHTMDRSSYRIFQFYQMENPATNRPWTSGEIFTSGIKLGVEKL